MHIHMLVNPYLMRVVSILACQFTHIRISMVVVQHLRLSTKHVDGCISTCRLQHIYMSVYLYPHLHVPTSLCRSPYIHMSVIAHPHVGPPISTCRFPHIRMSVVPHAIFPDGYVNIQGRTSLYTPKHILI